MRPSPSLPRGIVLLLLAFKAAPAAAQGISGTVIEEDSRRPVASALVQLLPAAPDSILMSTVTGPQGRFHLRLLKPADYRVRILRIGFRPWTSPPLTVSATGEREEQFTIPAVPVVLSELTVETKSPCRGSPAEDQRMALLWDDARTALGLLGAGTPEDLLEFRSRLSKRMVDPGDHLVSENTLLAFGRGAWPIASQPPESLAQFGFVQPRDMISGPVYFGPDVAVFFSEAFLQSHCFRLIPGSDPTLIGLGFEPVKTRKVVDIEGVLWLDREQNRLRRLEYRYTELWPWVPKGSAGGRLDFQFLAGGQPVLTGWSIRAPVARIEDWSEGTRVRDETTTRPFFGPGKVVLHGFREEIGEVNDIRLANGQVLWQRQPSADSSNATSIPSEGAQRP